MANNKYIEFFDPVTSTGINTSRRGFLPAGRYYGFDGFTSPNLTHTDKVKFLGNDNTTEYERAVLVSNHGTIVFFENPVEVLSLLTPTNTKFQVIFFRFLWDNTPGGATYNFQSGPLLDNVPTTPPAGADPTDVAIGYFVYGTGDLITNWVPYDKPFLSGNEIDTSDFARYSKVNPFDFSNFEGYQELTPADITVDTDTGYDTGNYYRLQVSDEGNTVFVDFLGAPDPLKISDIDCPTIRDGHYLNIFFLRAPAGAVWSSDATKIALLTYTGTEVPIESLHSYTFRRLRDTWVLTAAMQNLDLLIAELGARVTDNENALIALEDRVTQLEAGATLNWVDLSKSSAAVTVLRYAVLGNLLYLEGTIVWASGSNSNPAFVLTTDAIPINGQTVIPCGVRGDNPTANIGFASVYVTNTGMTLGVEFTTSTPTSTAVSIKFLGIAANT